MNRKKPLWTLILLQVVYILFIPVWLFIAGMSVMMFDTQQAVDSVVAWLVFSAIWLYPLGILAELIGGWVQFSRRRYKSALIWNGVPLIWIVPLGGFLVYSNFS